jgi:tRNA-2-methylthio-N6-dimethylallyladenosine synthase
MTSPGPSCCIEVYGCQMNVHDGETIAGILSSAGFALTDSTDDADVILVVTCAVREHAETRALGRITHLGGLRVDGSRTPMLVICGCVAQEHGETLLQRLRVLDLVVGPDSYWRLPDLIREGQRAAVTSLDGEEYEGLSPVRKGFPRGFVTIMRGCDNYCSYCIVPEVRGREHSRDSGKILAEVSALKEEGYGEITLLGQNVNSYGSGGMGFSELLESVSDTAGDMWVRFVTSHPKDFSAELAEVIASCANVCNQLHLPVQSGNDRILSLMNRKYSRQEYLDLIGMIRETVDGIVLSTDVIAGFPGETSEEFNDTLSLLEQVRFDYAFLFKFSERSGTAACDLPGALPEEVRLNRLNRMQELQTRITRDRSKRLVGSSREVLITGSAKQERQQASRTKGNRLVILQDTDYRSGTKLEVRITSADGWTHFGTPIGES